MGGYMLKKKLYTFRELNVGARMEIYGPKKDDAS